MTSLSSLDSPIASLAVRNGSQMFLPRCHRNDVDIFRFHFSLPKSEALFKRSTARLNLNVLKLTPHCAKHGAASYVYATTCLSLRDIQKRGRWKNPASV